MKELLEAAMDLETAAHRLVALFESRITKPTVINSGQTIRFRCVCGMPVDYNDKYCRECGRMQTW